VAKKKLVVLSGAGISAESGIKTFRDADGLWEGHDVMEVATPQGFEKNPELVLEFYNQRRAQLKDVAPNLAHDIIASFQSEFEVMVVTQNVDDLHERAGSQNIIHLHGELKKVRSTKYEYLVYDCEKDINIGDNCEKGYQLRPHIVWFGEDVPLLENSIKYVSQADFIIVVGSSMQVYPAASLVAYAQIDCKVFYVDPKPMISRELANLENLEIITEVATIGMKIVKEKIIDKSQN
jgi:NAD-dependent deacetylase